MRSKAINSTHIIADPLEGPEGLRGWLIVIGLWLAATVLRAAQQGYLVYKHSIFSGMTEEYLSFGSQYFHPERAHVIFLEAAAYPMFVLLGGYALYAFFGKRKTFPYAFIALALCGYAYRIADYSLTKYYAGMPLDHLVRTTVPSALATIVLIAYLVKSKRVKNTFVR